ncbi:MULTISPECIES: hypothetical protein [unclassified Nostoc]|uniref:hypothetical protein n=1 Tax=unclassified Nostoc TaxID=2593658 RepID=UPI0025D3B7E1|nr:hypothetical protein [Nostoc sp. JL31]MBN3892316.1 hypothetical protein [Nostoc sp. JL31]
MVNRLQEDIHQLPMRSCAISQGVCHPLLAISQKPNPREAAQNGFLCHQLDS